MVKYFFSQNIRVSKNVKSGKNEILWYSAAINLVQKFRKISDYRCTLGRAGVLGNSKGMLKNTFFLQFFLRFLKNVTN